jgi:RNA polymerase sigma-70 factor (ECF subfamily)
MTVSVFDYEAELGACAAGDSAAFLALYTQEAPTMFTLARQMLDDDAAEAVLHEAFVLIWRNAAGYSPTLGTARAWMYSILRYRALHHLRAARASGAFLKEREQQLPALQPKPDSGAIAQALATLPQPQLEALLQAYLHGGDCAHIADRLDRSEPDIQASIEAALLRIDEAVRA